MFRIVTLSTRTIYQCYNTKQFAIGSQSAIQGDKYESHLRAKLEFIELWESITKGRKVTKDIKSALRFGDLTSTKSLSVPEVVELKNKMINYLQKMK
jgi:hypothetical protein